MTNIEIATMLRESGLSVTAIRVALIDFLRKNKQPLSADQLVDALRPAHPTLNRTTMYRDLARLVQVGLVEEVLLSSRARVYELTGSHHHHAICTNCDSVQHIHIPEQLGKTENVLKKRHGFSVQRHSLEFYGLCAPCSRRVLV